MVYLAAVCILHDKAQAVVCLEGVFQSLKAEKAELSDLTGKWCWELIGARNIIRNSATFILQLHATKTDFS